MHIFSDLRPYICTFTECGDQLVQFPNRAAWAEHEFSNHRTTQSWTCPECAEDFLEVSTWEKHLQETHRLFFSGPKLQVAKDMALRTEARRIEDDECPLCRIVVGKPRRGFVKHVGRHMEEIALMALPRDVEEDTEEGSLGTDDTSLEKSSQSFHSKLPTEKDREEAVLGESIEEDEVTYSLKIPRHLGDTSGLIGSLQTEYVLGQLAPALAFEPSGFDNVIVRGPKEGADRAREEILNPLPWIVESSHNPTESTAQAQLPTLKSHDTTVENYETQNNPINEKGRPKRAAAPTFGDIVKLEPATPAPTSARRGAAAVKEANGSLSSEKPTARRTRTVPAKEKVGRKGKAPLLAAAPGPSPQKSVHEAMRSVSKEPTAENEQRVEEIEGAQLLAGLTSGQPYTAPVMPQTSPEGWPVDQPLPMNVDPTQKQVQPFIQEQPPVSQQKSGGTTSSYWSVPEQNDFYNLLRYFGTNWPAIATTMKTKTHIMVMIPLPNKASKITDGVPRSRTSTIERFRKVILASSWRKKVHVRTKCEQKVQIWDLCQLQRLVEKNDAMPTARRENLNGR